MEDDITKWVISMYGFLIVITLFLQPPTLPVMPERGDATPQTPSTWPEQEERDATQLIPTEPRVIQEVAADRDDKREKMPEMPPALAPSSGRVGYGFISPGFHLAVTVGAMFHVGTYYTAPYEWDVPEPDGLFTELFLGVLYKFRAVPWLSVGFEFGGRSASPLPTFHAGPWFAVDLGNWMGTVAIRISSKDDPDKPDGYLSRGTSFNTGLWFKWASDVILHDVFLMGVSFEYWSGEHYYGEEYDYDEPGQFVHKELIFSIRWMW